MNEQLSNYIKQELKKGLSREELKTSLISKGGWSRADVEEIFSSIFAGASSEQPISDAVSSGSPIPAPMTKSESVKESIAVQPKHGFKKSLIFLVSIVVLSAIVTGILWYLNQGNVLFEQAKDAPAIQENMGLVGSRNENGVIDCEDDLSCLATAAKDCSPATLIQFDVLDILDITQRVTSFEEIKGMENGKCVFYFETVDTNVAPNEQSVKSTQDMVENGEMTQEEFDKTMKELEERAAGLNMTYDAIEGAGNTCKVDTSELTEILKRWENKEFSANDWDNAECEGPFFKQAGGFGISTSTPAEGESSL